MPPAPLCRKAAHDSPVLTLTFFTRLVLLCLSFLQRSFRFPRSGWPPFYRESGCKDRGIFIPLQIFLLLFFIFFFALFSSPYPSVIYTQIFFRAFFASGTRIPLFWPFLLFLRLAPLPFFFPWEGCLFDFFRTFFLQTGRQRDTERRFFLSPDGIDGVWGDSVTDGFVPGAPDG